MEEFGFCDLRQCRRNTDPNLTDFYIKKQL